MSALTPARPNFADPVAIHGLALAPDGARVALLYMRHGQAHLALFGLDAAHARADAEIPLDTGRPGGLVWSPDGTMVAFYAASMESSACHVYVLRVDVGRVRDVTPALRGHAHIPCWSPDSSRLAFAAYEPPLRPDYPPHVFTVDLVGGHIARRTSGPAADFTPRFAPDGRALAFRRDGDIWLLDLRSGGERRVTGVDTATLGQGCFSPDGTQIVFEYGPTDARRIAIVDVATRMVSSPARRRTDVRSPCWSETGAGIAFVDEGARVNVVSPSGVVHWTVTLAGRGVRASPSLGPRWAARVGILAMTDADGALAGDGNVWVAARQAVPHQITFFPSEPSPHKPTAV